MKRFIFLLASIFIIGIIPFAHAGVWDSVQDYTISGVLALIFTIVSTIFGKKWAALKAPVQDLLQAAIKYRDAKLESSVGGKEVTQDEWNAIFAEVKEAIDGLLAAIPASWFPANKTV